jgi:hypothetical protein
LPARERRQRHSAAPHLNLIGSEWIGVSSPIRVSARQSMKRSARLPAAATVTTLLGDVRRQPIQTSVELHALGRLQAAAGAIALLAVFDAIAARVKPRGLAAAQLTASLTALDANVLTSGRM